MEERDAFLAFNLTPGIGPSRLRALLDHCGTASAAWAAAPAEWHAAGLDRRSIEALEQRRISLDLAREWLAIERNELSGYVDSVQG